LQDSGQEQAACRFTCLPPSPLSRRPRPDRALWLQPQQPQPLISEEPTVDICGIRQVASTPLFNIQG